MQPTTSSTTTDPLETVFRAVGMPDRPGSCFDVAIRGNQVVRLDPVDRAPRQMLLPALADLHVHANRAFTSGPTLPCSLSHAVEMAEDLFASYDESDFAEHADRYFREARRHGTTRLRTHADISRAAGLRAIRGTLAARARAGAEMQIEIVAFAVARSDVIEPSVQDKLREACRLGATLLGAVPSFYASPRDSIDALLDLAAAWDVGVDVHLDEHLDGQRSLSLHLADATRLRGLNGRVTLSHGCAMATLDPSMRRRVADALAAVGIDVIVLPSTNLYLQDRDASGAVRRGLAPVKELLAAGVQVRFASDNAQDLFYPYGSGDLLEVAFLADVGAQLDDIGTIVRGICAGKCDIEVGSEASFVLIPGASWFDILIARPGGRTVVQKGLILPAEALRDEARSGCEST